MKTEVQNTADLGLVSVVTSPRANGRPPVAASRAGPPAAAAGGRSPARIIRQPVTSR